jgi:hypothetical protein
MKQLPLKRVEYCIPGSGAAVDGMKVRKNRVFGLHFQMTNVSIDFENKRLRLAGDIGLVPHRSRKSRWPRSTPAGERIKVNATIYPGFSAELASTEGELVFSLEGIMEDSRYISACSGLLVVDNLIEGQGSEAGEWHATLYVYDDHIDGREIKLRLTMYDHSDNAELN